MANERLGASFSIDVTNLKAGLTQANRLIRESESQFKAAAAGLDDWTKSEEGVTAKIRSLNEITDIQKKKVAALKTEYNNLIKNGMDPTSREAVELRTKINQEEAALASNEKELKRQQEALKHVGDESEKTGDKISKMGDIAKAAGKVAAAAFTAAAAAVGALLKSSIEGYAQYEQLVGGVETLFGAGGQSLEEYAKSVGKSVDEAKGEYDKLMNAQNTMIENANNAYKTAGMSANEYMENVTGFSASLISSLDGDTEKAAAAADRAMRDISDNANKMGTDMSSIVDTYQSLARGNYQMLDNLKLGYGGTKAEMERMIADANKVKAANGEMANLSIDSFADVTEAIHIIQDEMGITGTTAKEASTTIQGSVGMMKSAWANLATGLADENANIDQLITNFIDSVGSVAENLLPRVTVALDGIMKLAERLLPQIPPLIEQFLPVIIDGIMNLLDGIVEIFPKIVDTILDVIPQLLSALIKMLPTILKTIVKMITQVIKAITKMIPDIVKAIMEVLPLLIDALVSSIPQLIEAAIQFLMAIVQAIPTIIEALIVELPNIINTIINALIEAIPQLIEGAIQLFMAMLEAIPVIIDALIQNGPKIVDSIVTGLLNSTGALIDGTIKLCLGIGEGLIKSIPDIVAKIPQIITSMVKALGEGVKEFANIGKKLIEGLWEGIKGMGDWLWQKCKDFFGGIWKGIKGFFGIHSPSKKAEDEIGKNIALGIGIGFEKTMSKVNKQIQNALWMDDIGINARVSGSMNAGAVEAGRTVVINQTNNYSQAHSRFEIYKSKQQTKAAVQLALAGV